jgi:hypothetical protein
MVLLEFQIDSGYYSNYAADVPVYIQVIPRKVVEIPFHLRDQSRY